MQNNKSCFRLLSAKEISGHGGITGLLRHDTRENIWRDQEIQDKLRHENCIEILMNPVDVLEKIKDLVKEKTGRKLQEKAMPIREAVLELPMDFDKTRMAEIIDTARAISDTPLHRSINVTKEIDGKKTMVTEPILDEHGNQVQSPLGIKLIAVMFHADEGHWTLDGEQSAGLRKENGTWMDIKGNIHDPIEENLVWRPHNHAHLWYDVIDHDTGKTIKVSSDELSQIQDIVAEHLHMERGERNSKRIRLTQEEYNRKKMIEADLERTERELQANEKRFADLHTKIEHNSSVLDRQGKDFSARESKIEAMMEKSKQLSQEIADKQKELSSLPTGYGLYLRSRLMMLEDLNGIMGARYPGKLSNIGFTKYEGCWAAYVERVTEDKSKTIFYISQSSDDIHIRLPGGQIIQGSTDKELSDYFQLKNLEPKAFPRIKGTEVSAIGKTDIEKALVGLYNKHCKNSTALRALIRPEKNVAFFRIRYTSGQRGAIMINLLDGNATAATKGKTKQVDPMTWIVKSISSATNGALASLQKLLKSAAKTHPSSGGSWGSSFDEELFEELIALGDSVENAAKSASHHM